jgi:hypothetical protein
MDYNGVWFLKQETQFQDCHPTKSRKRELVRAASFLKTNIMKTKKDTFFIISFSFSQIAICQNNFTR